MTHCLVDLLRPSAGGYMSVELAGSSGSSRLRLTDVNNANAAVGWDYSSGDAQGFFWEARARTGMPQARNYLDECSAAAPG